MKKFIIAVILLLMTFTISIGNVSANILAYYLPLFETSDVHGYIANTKDDDPLYMLAYIADKVKDVRGHNEEYDKDKAILLDGGDIYQGNPLSNLLNKGDSMSAAYALMDYDAVTIGNHDFDWGIEKTVDSDKTMKDYSFNGHSGKNNTPVIASNIYKNGNKIDFAFDYIILNKKAYNSNGDVINVNVGVVGFAGDYASSIMTDKFTGQGYTIDYDFNKVNAIAKKLEDEGLCSATILLVHEDAEEIASSIGNTSFDLILGGHTHSSKSGKNDNNIPYIEPACNGNGYSYCDLGFNADGSFNNISNVKSVFTNNNSSKLLNTSANVNELDDSVAKLTSDVIGELDTVLNTNIGYITENTYRYKYISGSGERSTTNGNWIASIIMRSGNADIAFVNSGGLRTDVTLSYGEDKKYITYSDVYTLFPFDNHIYTYEITYDELVKVFNYSFDKGGKSLFSQMVGMNCYYTFGSLDALVTYDGKVIYNNGEVKEEFKDKKVKLAVSEYVATTNRDDSGMDNPLISWNFTDKLISNTLVDNEAAINVLEAEAKENNGKLSVDTDAHYINSKYKEANSNNNSNNTNKNNYTIAKKNNLAPIIICVVIVVIFIALGSIIIVVIIKRNKNKNS